MSRPYDLSYLDSVQLEALWQRRPDLRKEIHTETVRRQEAYDAAVVGPESDEVIRDGSRYWKDK